METKKEEKENKKNFSIGKTLFWTDIGAIAFDYIFGTNISETTGNLFGGYLMVEKEIDEITSKSNEIYFQNVEPDEQNKNLDYYMKKYIKEKTKQNIEININVYKNEIDYLSKTPIVMEEEFYKKIKDFIYKVFEKKGIYKCDIEIYYMNKNEYLKRRVYNITTYKFSKNKKNEIVTTYFDDIGNKIKHFYSKNKQNSISFDFKNGKIKSKFFYVNSMKTRLIYYEESGYLRNIEFNRYNKDGEKYYYEKEKIYLKTCNGIQYNIVIIKCDKNEYGKSYIEAKKNKKIINKFEIYFENDNFAIDKINKLKNYGETFNFSMGKCILDFENCTLKTLKEIEREEEVKRILKEKKEKEEEFKNGYHTKSLDINFDDKQRKQFVNGYMVKKIYDYEFKIFIDDKYEYRTLKGELIYNLDLYLKKCYKSVGKEYELKSICNNYKNEDYSTDDYIYEAFGGDEETWEDYCEDIIDRYGD